VTGRPPRARSSVCALRADRPAPLPVLAAICLVVPRLPPEDRILLRSRRMSLDRRGGRTGTPLAHQPSPSGHRRIPHAPTASDRRTGSNLAQPHLERTEQDQPASRRSPRLERTDPAAAAMRSRRQFSRRQAAAPRNRSAPTGNRTRYVQRAPAPCRADAFATHRSRGISWSEDGRKVAQKAANCTDFAPPGIAADRDLFPANTCFSRDLPACLPCRRSRVRVPSAA
jgi:hypothetical protein